MPMKPEAHFERVVEALRRNPEVAIGSQKRGFGSSALKVNGKIFAMQSSKGELVLKLPKERVDELVASRNGRRFEPDPGRVMKQWFVAEPRLYENWLSLAREALRFVASRA